MCSAPLQDIPFILLEHIGAATWQRVTTGESAAVVYRLQDSTTRYLKISQHDAQFPVRDEAARLQWLQGRLPVPEVELYVSDTTQEYLLMSAVPGLHPMHDALQWPAQARLAFLVAAVQRVHALPLADCPFTWSIEQQLAAAWQNVQAGRVRTSLLKPPYQGHNPADLYQALRALRPQQEDWVVAHGDLYPVNIHADPYRKTLKGYIDVGRAGIADCYTDYAPLANAIMWHLGEDKVPQFFEQLGLAIDQQKLKFYQLLNVFL